MPIIKGRYLKKKEKPLEMPDLSHGVDSIFRAVESLRNTESDIEEAVDKKIDEIDTTLNKITSEFEEIKKIKEGKPGIDADPEKVAQMVLDSIEIPENGKDADETLIVEKVLARIPKIDEKMITKRVLSQLPDRKSDLKIIQENIEIDPMSVIEKIMALPIEKRRKLQLDQDSVTGLRQTMSAFQNQLGRGYLHGGGISNITGLVTAGTNVTITGSGTTASPYVINATGGGSVGPGTINEIAYFDTPTSIASLTVATYPSLTELSYVKGVTSSIQTQLNTKLSTITIGTTTTTSGTNTRVLFDDSGVVGEDAGLTYIKATDTLSAGSLNLSSSGTGITFADGPTIDTDGSANLYISAAGSANLLGSVGAVSSRGVGTAIFDLATGNANASAVLHISSPNAIGKAQMKFTLGGSVLTTPEAGAMETTNSHIYWTDSGGSRWQLDQQAGSASLTSTYIGYGDGSNFLTGNSNFTYAADLISFVGSIANNHTFFIKNSNSGVGARAAFQMGNDANDLAGFFWVNGSNTTDYAGANSVNFMNVQNAPLGFATNNAIRMYIDGGGKVGIGSGSPSYFLHLNTAATADLAIQTSGAGEQSQLKFITNAGELDMRLGGTASGFSDYWFMYDTTYAYTPMSMSSGASGRTVFLGAGQTVGSGANAAMHIYSTGVVINESGQNYDFRVESDTITNAFFIEGTDGAATLGAYGSGAITGTPTYLLAVDASGKVIETTAGSGSPGGLTTQVQFNDAGAFGGDAGLTYDKANNILSINTGGISVTGSGASPYEFVFQSNQTSRAIGQFQNLNASGFVSFDFLDNSSVRAGGFGYANPSAATLPNKFFIFTNSKDIIFSKDNTATSSLTIAGASGNLKFGSYGSGTVTGTATYNLAVDSSGTVIEVSTSGGSGLTWAAQTVNGTFVVNNGVLANKGTLLSYALPAASAVGDVIAIAGMNAGLWKITQAASQQIHFGSQNTTAGVGGSVASILTYDSVYLVCSVANLEWIVINSVGNFTIV